VLKIPDYLKDTITYPVLEANTFGALQLRASYSEARKRCVTDAYGLKVILAGNKEYATELNNYHLSAGDCVLIRRGTPVSCALLSDKRNIFKDINFLFSDAFLADFMIANQLVLNEDDNEPSQENILLLQPTPFLSSCLESFFPFFYYETPNQKQFLKLKLSELMLHLISGPDRNKVLSFFNCHIIVKRVKMQHKILKHLNTQVTIEELADMFSMSPSAFNIEFKKLFQMPPKKWINRMKMEKGYNLIANSDKNITEIAMVLGFNQTAHFTAAFKKHFQLTPSGLRRQCQRI